MQELPIIIVVMGALVMVVDHVRRLFAAVSLNRTLRQALEHHPASIPLLLEKLEDRGRFPLALGGWVFLGLGLLAAMLTAFAGADQDREAFLAAAIVAALGAILLAASHWVTRKSAG